MRDDDDDDINGAHILIDFEQHITIVRLVENIFLPSQITLKAEVMPSEESDNTTDFEIAFAKVRFWLENVVTRCIAFSKNNKEALDMLITEDGRNKSGNLLMLTPEEPVDENLAMLFQAKMTALADGKLQFGAVEIKSNNITGLRFTFVGDASEVLPKMEEWIGTHSYFDKPWWHRDDASTLDIVPAKDADLEDKPAWAYDLDFIAKAMKPKQDAILRPEFKPTVIDGGIKDEDE